MILSNKEDWTVTNDWLETQGPEGREAIKSSMRELEYGGYCVFEQIRKNGAISGSRWTFYDSPVEDENRTNRTNWRTPTDDDEHHDTASRTLGKEGDHDTGTCDTASRTPSEELSEKKDYKKEKQSSRSGKPPTQGDGRHSAFVSLFTDGFQQNHNGKKYVVHPKDMKALKDFLQRSDDTASTLYTLAEKAWIKSKVTPGFCYSKQATTIFGFLSRFNEIQVELLNGNGKHHGNGYRENAHVTNFHQEPKEADEIQRQADEEGRTMFQRMIKNGNGHH